MSLPKRVISSLGKSMCLAVTLLALSVPANAANSESIRMAQAGTTSNIVLADGHPDRYVVVKGDTLWDISGKFLRDPWLWPEIWYVNPQVENPHLIYPGDILTLVWVDGRPQLSLQRGETEKLSPRVRASALEEAIPTISYDAVAGFLARPGIISEDQRESAPYILSVKQKHLAAAAGMDVYVRGSKAAEGSDVYVIDVGNELLDPDNGDLLGYEANYVGHGRVDLAGDPARVHLLESHKEALVGDLLFSEPTEVPAYFIPHAPTSSVDGQVIAVAGGTTMAGQFMVVAFNRGSRHGIEPGHVLSVWKAGDVVRDKVKGGMAGGEKVQLPDEYAGRIMVFQVLDRISYGVIVNTVIEIGKKDKIRNP
jgi:hypothetical protein